MAANAALLLVFACASRAAAEWDPRTGVKDINVVEAALHKIVDSPLLTGAQLISARKVVADVEGAVQEVSTGKVSKEKRGQRIAAAIKELQGLQQQWALAASGNVTAMGEKAAVLKRELTEKRALLNKTAGMLRLARLQKELTEKKLQLQGLMDAKAKAQAMEREEKALAGQRATVAKLVASARAAAANGTRANQTGGPIQAILANLKSRARGVSAAIAQADAQEKKREVDSDRIINAHLPTTGKTDATSRSQLLIKSLAKRSRRAYRKARAAKEAELAELNEGIHSIEAGDVAALQKLMGRMRDEGKRMEAKSRGFLH